MLLDSRVDLILTMKCGRITSIGPTEMVLVEHVLSDIYDVCVKTERSRNRTFVWSEL
jgi:ABC-type enterochelin transport system ATPase subunit